MVGVRSGVHVLGRVQSGHDSSMMVRSIPLNILSCMTYII